MHYDFCTYFDANYLYRGLALYYSLKDNCSNFRLWILCMDEEVYSILSLMKLSNMELIRLRDFENGDLMLQEVKKNRNRIEYYFTCTPSLPIFIFKNFQQVDLITYIDADLYFFNALNIIYEEIKNYSIAIVKHNFSYNNKVADLVGIYNVSWLSFRRDENGLNCLNWWREACNQWCYDYVAGNKFADQKYLDDWTVRFKNVIVLKNKGINVAPWNVKNYSVYADKKNILIDGQPLIFFHFHGLKHLVWRFYYTGMSSYNTRVSNVVGDFIYKPYLKKLLNIKKILSHDGTNYHLLGSIRISNYSFAKKKFYINYKKIRQFIYMVYNVMIFGDYVEISEK